MAAESEQQRGLLTLPHAPNVKLAYEVLEGADSGFPAIMLSNSLNSSYKVLWKEFVEHFRDQYTIIMYDQRFHGESPLASGDYDYFGEGQRFEDLAKDVIALMDHLRIVKLHAFIGLSMGATTAIVLKAIYPERIGKTVAAGSALKTAVPPPGGEDFFAPLVKIAMEGPEGMAKLAEMTINRWFPGDPGQKFLEAHLHRKHEIVKMVAHSKPEGYVASVRALQNYDLTKYLEAIKIHKDYEDVLLIAGQMDGQVPVFNKLMSIIAGCRHEVVEESGHIVNIQKADEFNGLVENFLA
ncbi:Alpha/Beta hydrolase protein [Limtongia smithiae]|uniref:Alpha/Beta hydrolase protein n=1 Tax=Limtongia smithiae TaxID=1125753 RepID=UPI0034D01F55